MSLQFVFGNSGSGKSDYLYERVLKEAADAPERNYLILVPEQFTMQTQHRLVLRQKNHAIMNVDVLSFARLAYRVFDELGKQELVVLEETGKNLVLRKVAGQKKKELRVLGTNLNKMGYIEEVKSFISELMQYNISPEDLETFLKGDAAGEMLKRKLEDIVTMYRGFREYISGHYITAEEILSVLCEVAGESAILRDSVIVFDEFTGFTPVQNRVIRELMQIADKIIVSVTMDVREDFYQSRGIHELFAMSKKTVETLLKTAAGSKTAVETPVILKPGAEKRYRGAPDLFFMEQNLFRPGGGKWEGEAGGIRILGLKDPREELVFAAEEITRLMRQRGYRYKDIAVVTGDVPGYANYVPEIFGQYGIPFFIDQTRSLLFHPFLEFIRAALEVVEYDFSYESMFRFLRCGLFATSSGVLCGLPEDDAFAGVERLADADIDRLENYVLAKGIRGRKKWAQDWTFVVKGRKENDLEAQQEDLRYLNRVRAQIARAFQPLCEVFAGKGHTVAEQTYALYSFICSMDIEVRLKEKEAQLRRQEQREGAGCAAAARLAQEYAQIYRIVMDLLDKVTALLGDEVLSVREYGDILDAGFSAAKIGVIPPGHDRVTVGDIERTRLGNIKVLIFAGVNDGIVPGNQSSGSIISQLERERMADHHITLAPGAREKVFIQKFYLYLNMTKPSDALYVTYSRVGADGKARRRSYLIKTLLGLFADLKVEEPADGKAEAGYLTPESSLPFLIEGLSTGSFSEQAAALASWYLAHEPYREKVNALFPAAFFVHRDDVISRAVTRALYGTTLENSVTRLERFLSCAYAHFLSYGLALKERELQEFASVDMGNIYHDALERFARRVEASQYTWQELPEQVQENWIGACMEEAVAACRNTGVFEDARNRAMLERMRRTMRRTVWALVAQIRKGQFVPSAFEVSFSRQDDLKSIRFTLSDEEKMRLQGRIDRVDVCETKDKVYVKIIDYKSGNTSFSLLNFYHGLQLQLVVYLNAALELAEKKYQGKKAEPAGIFYYHINDPMVEGDGTESEEEIRRAVLEQLKLNGLVNEDPAVYRAMDMDFTGSSSVIPVAVKTDGSLKATSRVVSTQDFGMMSEHVNQVITDAGRRIFDGDAAVRPYQLDGRTGCDYCPYRTVCGFDIRLSGFSYRRLEKYDNAQEILKRLRQEQDGSGADRKEQD